MSIELKDTVELMNSKDWKDRFKAEYVQLLLRTLKLQQMLVNYGKDFEPNCSYDMLHEQLVYMKNYLNVLIQRANIENVDLTVLEEEENETER